MLIGTGTTEDAAKDMVGCGQAGYLFLYLQLAAARWNVQFLDEHFLWYGAVEIHGGFHAQGGQHFLPLRGSGWNIASHFYSSSVAQNSS